ncbi:hypothetical protein HYW36_02605 [Candidatus Saccharibacteria bacterium]|nr:hypothetical protein [Candidatus Saccharibacteria bacterium]
MSDESRDRFTSIVQGQLPSTKDRLRQALNDPKVTGYFNNHPERDGYADRQGYFKLLDYLAYEHGLFPEESTEVISRLSSRSRRQVASRNYDQEFLGIINYLEEYELRILQATDDRRIRKAARFLILGEGDEEDLDSEEILSGVAKTYRINLVDAREALDIQEKRLIEELPDV